MYISHLLDNYAVDQRRIQTGLTPVIFPQETENRLYTTLKQRLHFDNVGLHYVVTINESPMLPQRCDNVNVLAGLIH